MDSRFSLTFFLDGSCNGLGIGQFATPSVQGATASPNVWYSRVGTDVIAPALAQSVLFEVVLHSNTGQSRTVNFDNVFFGPAGVGAPRLEIGVPMLSSTYLVLLAVLLGLAALWQFRIR